MSEITSVEQLEALYGLPGEASTVKELDHVIPEYAAFIEASPFVRLATTIRRPCWRGDVCSSDLEQLEALYGLPGEASTVKELDHVIPEYAAFIEASPFVALAT